MPLDRPPSPDRPFQHSRAWGWTVLGVGVALAFAEGGIRQIATPPVTQWGPVSTTAVDDRSVEVRAYTEGIATSHFRPTRERIIPSEGRGGDSALLILGDSYVEALQVADAQTMGAQLVERLGHGSPRFSVHQFGWSGADVPQYVVVAPELTDRFHPARVVVVLTANDLGPDLLTASMHLVRDSGGDWRGAISGGDDRSTDQRGLLKRVVGRSTLLYELLVRMKTAVPAAWKGPTGGGAGGASEQDGGLPLPERARVSLLALRGEFGDRLRVLFIANVGVDGLRAPSNAEREVLRACAVLAIRCADTRDRMARDRVDSLRLSRGFFNTAPGAGHINATGHALAAETIANELVP